MKKHRVILKMIWWGYVVLFFMFVVIKFTGSFTELANKITTASFGENLNLMPFRTISVQLAHFSEGWARFNIVGNTIPFIPLGFLMPMVYHKVNSFAKILVIGISSVLLIELFQLFTRLGSFDVDDIMLNMIGILSGYFMLWFIKLLLKVKYLWRRST